MEDMEVTTMTEEQKTETETETTTAEQETETETTTTTAESPSTSADIDYSDGFYDMSENVIHDLFFELGVDLDYVPQNKMQCFSMALQFAAALWFIWWFVKMLWRLMIQSFTVGR